MAALKLMRFVERYGARINVYVTSDKVERCAKFKIVFDSLIRTVDPYYTYEHRVHAEARLGWRRRREFVFEASGPLEYTQYAHTGRSFEGGCVAEGTGTEGSTFKVLTGRIDPSPRGKVELLFEPGRPVNYVTWTCDESTGSPGRQPPEPQQHWFSWWAWYHEDLGTGDPAEDYGSPWRLVDRWAESRSSGSGLIGWRWTPADEKTGQTLYTEYTTLIIRRFR